MRRLNIFGRSPPDIFVSYARGNASFVEDLNQALKDARWRGMD